jgi:hypothetical protein
MSHHERRIGDLQEVIARKKRPRDQRIGVVLGPASTHELKTFDALLDKHLNCSLPAAYREFLKQHNGLGAQGTVLYRTDEANDKHMRSWPRPGIVYYSLQSLKDPKTSEWIAVGEDEFESFAISRDGKRFAKIDGLPEAAQTEYDSLDAMLCAAVDQMIDRVEILDD